MIFIDLQQVSKLQVHFLPHNSPPQWKFFKFESYTLNQPTLTHPIGCSITVAYISMPQGIKPHIVHANELHRAPLTKSATSNPTNWIIWISLSIASWRTTIFNLSWHRSPNWDPYFFITHYSGFFLVPSTTTKPIFSSTCSISKPATQSPLENNLFMVEILRQKWFRRNICVKLSLIRRNVKKIDLICW